MAGSVQSAKALAELQAVTKSSDDPDFDMNIEVGDRNARGGSGSSDGGNTPQGEQQQQQAPRPRPMPALGGDPLRELRGGTSYVSAPPLPSASSRFVEPQPVAPQGSPMPATEGQGGAARLPVQGQVAQQGATAGRTAASGPTLSEQSRRPANMPSVVVRAAPILAASTLSRAEMRRAERAEAARQNSHMMKPIRLDPSRAVQSAVSKMLPEAADTSGDWSAIAKVNAPVPAGAPAIARAISALKRSSWGATPGAANTGGHQRSEGVDPDPMVRFANEHARKRQALDVLFERFARIEATPVATAPRAASTLQRPAPPRLTPMMAPRRNAFQ